MEWDFRDQLQAVQRQITSDGQGGGKTCYQYDAGGQRVRKVTVNQQGACTSERVYLGEFELYREYNPATGDKELERETLHILDDQQRVALVETLTLENRKRVEKPVPFRRYQFGNHLGSASLELDEQAEPIAYEEYYPYGSTAYQALRRNTKTPRRYRYTGKERDEESGLYYYGARYYAPWLGRWISFDPLGLIDGPNAYEYARSSPNNLFDGDGHAPESKKKVSKMGDMKQYHKQGKATKGLDGKRSEHEHVKSRAIQKQLQPGYNDSHYGKSPTLTEPFDMAREKTPTDNRLARELEDAQRNGEPIPDDLRDQVTAEGAARRTIEARDRAIAKRTAAGQPVDDLLAVTDERIKVCAALQEHAGPAASAQDVGRFVDLEKVETGFNACFENNVTPADPPPGAAQSVPDQSPTDNAPPPLEDPKGANSVKPQRGFAVPEVMASNVIFALGAINSLLLIGIAIMDSDSKGSPQPLVEESARQVGGWGGGMIATAVGTALGLSFLQILGIGFVGAMLGTAFMETVTHEPTENQVQNGTPYPP
jgi:RHS repeat-associated protein